MFGLRRFGFDARALDLARALFDLAQLYPDYRIPECVGGYARGEQPTPGAYPRANTPQLWNATAFPLDGADAARTAAAGAAETLMIDPVLPAWLPELDGARPARRRGDGDAALLARRARRVAVRRAAQAGHAARRPAAAARVADGRPGRSIVPAPCSSRVLQRAIAIEVIHDDSTAPVREQVMVITGASSGIGLVTASRPRGAARASCSRRATSATCERAVERHPTRRRPRRSTSSPTSRTRSRSTRSPTRRSASSAASTRGSTTPPSRCTAAMMELPVEDMRRQMDVNYWGQVYGSRAAVRHLRERGGALINVGSALCRPRDPAAGQLLRRQARAQGVHRRAADGARGGGRADLGDAREAREHRHAVLREGADVPRRRATAGAARVRAGGRRRSDPRTRRSIRCAS